MKLVALVAGLLSAVGAAAPPVPAWVVQSARQVPVAASADVVVCGGSSGAAAAALAAARAGASVVLITSRHYLGEDLAGTMRLFLEEGETPATELGKAIFTTPPAGLTHGVAYTYKADRQAGGKHPDTATPSRLNDGKWATAQYDSVQYDGDVTIDLTLEKEATLRSLHAMVFRGGDYAVQSLTVSTSVDGKTWRPAGQAAAEDGGAYTILRVELAGPARHVRCAFRKTAQAERVLLGEVLLNAASPGDAAQALRLTTPLQVKRVLDRALRQAGVQVFYGCYAAELLRDAEGQVAGVTMCNRTGRQAIAAKLVVDALHGAPLAQRAGAEFRRPAGGSVELKWIAIAADAAKTTQDNVKVRQLDVSSQVTYKANLKKPASRMSWWEYTVRIPFDEGWQWRARAEQAVRDVSYEPSQVYTADLPFFVHPWCIRSAKPAGEWPGADKLDLVCLRPEGQKRLWVLGGCADMPREAAERLLRPTAFLAVGERVGQALARQAKELAAPAGVRVEASHADTPAVGAGEVRELLAGIRPLPRPARVEQAASHLPVLGDYDVVVIGGGTSGGPAGIAAARRGARTLVVEHLHALGGVGTIGMIGKYWYGNRVGFTNTVPQNPTEVRMEWYRSELRKARADIWMGCLGCGALVEGGRVVGAVVATPHGRGVVRARIVIDATGSADVAIAAGAAYVFVDDDFALQASHIPLRLPGQHYLNGDRPSIDDSDVLHVRSAIQDKLDKTERVFDLGQILDTRERRRIVGEYTLDWLDIINRRTFPDTVVRSTSDYDSHGYQIHPFFALTHVPARTAFWANTPFRCILPKGLEGIMVVGLGHSAHRDAMPITRMQPDLHNLGYAAGAAGAMAAKSGKPLRELDVRVLQKHLVQVGNLPASVLTDDDSYPIPVQRLKQAVAAAAKDYAGVELLLAQPGDSIPLLKAAHAAAKGRDRLIYAHVLAAMGDATGIEDVCNAILAGGVVKEVRKGAGGIYGLIRAAGFTRDKRAVEAIVRVAGDPGVLKDSPLLRAAAFALGRIGDPAAAPVLADLLAKLGPPRENHIQGLMTAVALLRCGDREGKAKVWLEQCAASSDATLARVAWQALGIDR
ncbi:MAG: hypothetical protein BWX88_01765 [Planctomycetes bacterium ADurb.Bin126]|nr:MAG: hypothetical protein BWX88_01765 [Planctomycetes bacterium ADurb.Bin126]